MMAELFVPMLVFSGADQDCIFTNSHLGGGGHRGWKWESTFHSGLFLVFRANLQDFFFLISSFFWIFKIISKVLETTWNPLDLLLHVLKRTKTIFTIPITDVGHMAHRLYALLTKQNSLIRLHCLPFRLHLSDTLLCGKAICKFQGDYSKFSGVWIFRTFMVRVFLPIYRDYYMVTFISSSISSRGKRYQPKAKGRGLIPLFKGWCGPWYESNLYIINLL